MRFRDRDGNEYIVEESQCSICELEMLLKERDRELRRSLQRRNPVTDTAYDQLFQELIDIDRDRRILRGVTVPDDRESDSAS